MTISNVLSILQIELNMNIPETGRTEIQNKTVTLLNHYIAVAMQEIKKEGLTLPQGTDADPFSEREGELVTMYAAWKYNNRITHEGMPRAVRYALNNAIFSQKASS